MRKPLAAATAAVAAIFIAGCSSSSNAGAHYANAQAIADKLTAAGFTVSMLHKSTGNAITEAGGQSYDFTVTAKPGLAPGDSGINLFPNHEALTSWISLSKSFGGIAVAGDTWAVSLATGGKARASSVAMAPRIATALGGTVAE